MFHPLKCPPSPPLFPRPVSRGFFDSCSCYVAGPFSAQKFTISLLGLPLLKVAYCRRFNRHFHRLGPLFAFFLFFVSRLWCLFPAVFQPCMAFRRISILDPWVLFSFSRLFSSYVHVSTNSHFVVGFFFSLFLLQCYGLVDQWFHGLNATRWIRMRGLTRFGPDFSCAGVA